MVPNVYECRNGLHSDERFLDMAPGAFPGYSLLTAFGRAAPLNRDYQHANRVLPFPFHFLNNNHAMNVRPRNYSWRDFYDHVIDLTGYSFCWKAIARQFRGTRGLTAAGHERYSAVSTGGFGRLGYHKDVRRRLDKDPPFLPYFEQETTEIPRFYLDLVRKDLGLLWEWLPEGALDHDPNAYSKSERRNTVDGLRPTRSG